MGKKTEHNIETITMNDKSVNESYESLHTIVPFTMPMIIYKQEK